jgi:DNA-binding beta-propeller fold protein YncE
VASAVAAAPERGPKSQPGALKFRGCVSGLPGGKCAGLPAGSLVGTAGIAVSPDGRSVYATSYGGDAVTAFLRGSGGKLAFQGCVTGGGAGGCQAAPGEALRGPAGIVVSPGGGDVYVASGLGSAVTRLARGADGQVSFAACSSDRPSSGCAPLGFGVLAGAAGIAVGPGGNDLYVAATDAATVSHLVRNAGGGLEMSDCLSAGEVPGCRRTRTNVLGGAAAIAVAANGRDVYVASYSSAAVVRLRRGAGGRLAFRGCIADDGGNGCRPLPSGSVAGSSGIAISPSGRDVYVVSQVGTVTRLRPARRRGLEFVSCLSARVREGCDRAPGRTLSQATGIAISPSGADLYVTAQGGSSIVHLRPSARGDLQLAECLAARASRGCRKIVPAALRGAYAVAASPDGRAVYATAARGRSVAAFSRRP